MSPPSTTKYDVFISFRGGDTRTNFTSHLCEALRRKKIETFIDDDNNKVVRRGDQISKAIQESKIYVVVFSKDYASSKWCLDELVKIIECGKIVVPVFYEVNPSDVKKQTGSFQDAFAKHGEYYKESVVQRWKTALSEAADLSGWNSAVIRDKSVFVEEIVKDILKRLNDMFSSDDNYLVGVYPRIKEIEPLLDMGSSNVSAIEIWGMGGIGKTTLAHALFKEISYQFEVSYFIQNVGERMKTSGLIRMQQELLSTILGDIDTLDDKEPALIRKKLGRKKFLITFDDVTDLRQIEFLTENLDLLCPGSRIIITTRNKGLLTISNGIYEVKGLMEDEALQLFSHHAFGQNTPTVDYLELSNMIIRYANGVPLALKVLGSFLLGRRKQDWHSALKKLERPHHMPIQNLLKMCYDELDCEEKNVFLDIACFFNGEHKDRVIAILDARDVSAETRLSVLIDKNFLTISNNRIRMHDLLQETGRQIVQQESNKDLGKRSRLWSHEDIHCVLTNNMGTEAIEGISLDMSKIREIHLSPHAFAKMRKLRFFKFYDSCYKESKNKVHVFEDLEFVSTQLRYFHWFGYPLKQLPSNFCPENLIELKMPYSSLKQPWDGVQHLAKLKHLDFSYCKELIRCPDLSLATNLERLTLNGCTSLLEIPSSIRYLNELEFLDLSDCKSVKSLPSGIHLKSLGRLTLSGCTNLKTFPEISFNIKELFLDGTAIEEVPSSIVYLSKLVLLNLKKCSRLKSLPSSLGQLSSLEILSLGSNNFESTPSNIMDLSKLTYLNLSYCQKLQSLPELPRNLLKLEAECCESLEALPGLSSLFSTTSEQVQVVNLVKYYQRKVNLVNCFKLDPNALKDTVEDALHKIQLVATAWWEKHDKNISAPCACICFPGSEISEWFGFQSIGSFINLKLPPNWDNSKFVGVVICIIVAPGYHNAKPIVAHEDDHEKPNATLQHGHDYLDMKVRCACRLKYKDGQWNVLQCDRLWGWQWHIGKGGLHNFGSDHALLGYDFTMFGRDFGNSIYSNELSLKFYLEDGLGKVINGYKVKKCGVRLMYA